MNEMIKRECCVCESKNTISYYCSRKIETQYRKYKRNHICHHCLLSIIKDLEAIKYIKVDWDKIKKKMCLFNEEVKKE